MQEKMAKLVRMANQIGDFYGPYQDAEAVTGIYEHLRSFWTKSMRAELIAFAKAGGEGLRPRVALALERFAEAK
jgi:formate dehydrogenase subunit delta